MSDNWNDKLESMLRSRGVEAPSHDLAERIILRAAVVPQQQNFSFWRFMRELCAEFHLPKPAYVLAGALAIGIAVGYSAPSDIGTNQIDDSATAQVLADEELL
jgi:hypothetical protein